MGGNGPICFRQLPVGYLSLVSIQQVQRSVDKRTIDQGGRTWVDRHSNRVADRVKLRARKGNRTQPPVASLRKPKRENLALLRKWASLPHSSVLFVLRLLPRRLPSTPLSSCISSLCPPLGRAVIRARRRSKFAISFPPPPPSMTLPFHTPPAPQKPRHKDKSNGYPAQHLALRIFSVTPKNRPTLRSSFVRLLRACSMTAKYSDGCTTWTGRRNARRRTRPGGSGWRFKTDRPVAPRSLPSWPAFVASILTFIYLLFAV